MTDYRTLLRLLSIQGIGSQKIRSLASHVPTLADVFNTSPQKLLQVPGIDKTLAHRIAHKEYNDPFVDYNFSGKMAKMETLTN